MKLDFGQIYILAFCPDNYFIPQIATYVVEVVCTAKILCSQNSGGENLMHYM